MTYQSEPSSYAVVRMNVDGQWDVLERFTSYSEADLSFDEYCDRFQNALLDVIPVY